MKTQTQAVVIGGGVVGCSVLYHLTKLGWTDVVLVERTELTAGSTWHAAGGFHTLNSDPNVAKLQGYTLKVFEEIEQLSGHACGLHKTGGLYLASSDERLDYLRSEHAKHRYLGIASELISVEEAVRLNPILDPTGVKGVLWDPSDGHIDPSGVTNAYAKSAQLAGAEVYRDAPVLELNPQPDSIWQVVTPKGTIHTEVVVNAGGLWAREVAALAGVFLPIFPMEHQYLITEAVPELVALDREIVHCLDFEGESYLRQEREGVVLGVYERDCRHWSVNGTPQDFGLELLAPDLERMLPKLEVAYQRYPCLADVGIKQIINGAMVFAPDGNPTIGPVPGLRNFYLACGVMAGFSQGAGVGMSVAEWIIEGEPSMDVFAMDCARFGKWATKQYTHAKTRENYQRRFQITFPNEELPAGRPLRTTPVYERLKVRNAVFGSAFGLEHALWFAPEGEEPYETPTFRRSNAFGPTGEECRAVRENVGLLEISNYAKYEVSGPGASKWLDRLFSNTLPGVRRVRLSPLLSEKGKLYGDFTIARLTDERFLLVGSGIAETFHTRWFLHHLPPSGVQFRSRCSELFGFAVAGPNSRTLLEQTGFRECGPEDFRFLDIREQDVGRVPAIVMRVSFTGELGYEIYVEPEWQLALHDTLLDTGAEFGLRHFGGRALQSLRVEKGFGSWTQEYTPDYTPWEAEMGRFVKLDKGDFIGRAAAAETQHSPRYTLVLLEIAVDDADAIGDEPVFCGDEVVGFVTSGAYGHTVGKSLALAYVASEMSQSAEFAVEILGERRAALRLTEVAVDPSGARLRS